MPSPFPGMNPYLEQDDCWLDFHQSYLTCIRDMIAAQVSAEFVVKLEAHLYVQEADCDERSFLGRADLAVAHPVDTKPMGNGTAVLEAPVVVDLRPAPDFEKWAYIEIHDKMGRGLVTVVELLSPCNKLSGPDRDQYVGKRRNLLYGSVNFVEMDLRRLGQRMPVPEIPPCDYCILVRKAVDRRRVYLWPLRLRDTLPNIPIPLRPTDADIFVPLQTALHKVYDAAHYQNYIYSGSPQPPLSAEDDAWARQLIASR